MWSITEIESLMSFVAYLIYNEKDKYSMKKLNDAVFKQKKEMP